MPAADKAGETSEMERTYYKKGQIESVARRLVDLAKENNSTDNISVIVFFLTDPTDINNRSIDINGHRPKVVNQDGVIMETDLQTSEKLLPSPDSATNGLLETNGNHLMDPLKSESDEDFGPETDVDAVDDVLSSPKSLNPFANDCWPKQQMTMHDEEKIFEISSSQGEEIMKFSHELESSVKEIDVKDPKAEMGYADSFNMKYLNENDDGLEICDEEMRVNVVNCKNNQDGLSVIEELSFNDKKDDLNSINCSVDNVNALEPSVINNYEEVLNSTNNKTSDNNKYLEEINFEKKEFDNFNFTDFNDKPNESNFQQLGQANDLDDNFKPEVTDNVEANINMKNEANVKEDPSQNHIENDKDSLLRNNEIDDSSPMLEKGASDFGIEPEITKQIIPDSTKEKLHIDEEVLSNEKFDLDTKKLDTKLFIEEPLLDTAPKESPPLDASGYPPELCSVIDTVEAAKASELMSPTTTDFNEKGSPDVLSQPALVPDGEAKDEPVAESGGEVEDSEDDEWNYFKVESDQKIPVDKPLDLAEPQKQSCEEEKEQPTMNSPLNPDAAEFIPVSPVASAQENSGETPFKAIPQDLSDIVSASPNWANMASVKVPEESDFLREIKSRPSNIFEDMEAPQKDEDFMAGLKQMNHSAVTENDATVPAPSGIELAKDMTSSFFDPLTMGSPTEASPILKTENAEPVTQKVEGSLTEESYQQFEKEEIIIPQTNLDLMSPASADAVTASPVSPETPKSTGVEASMSPGTELGTPELSHPSAPTEIVEIAAAPTLTPSPKENEILEKSAVEENKINEIITNAAVPAAAVAVATAAAVATKDIKKPSTKTTTPGKATTKTATPTKPLLNGTKTSAPAKKPLTGTPLAKPAAAAKTSSTTASATKTPMPRISSTTKTTTKTSSVASTINKTQATPKPATSATAKTSTLTRTVSSTTRAPITQAPKPSAPKTSTISSTLTAPKPKPRVQSVSADKKLNGDVKPATKLTETTTTTITKRPNSTTTTTTTIRNRVSLTSRPTTAPTKSTTVKTTTTVTRTANAKPRTTFTSTTATSTVTNSGKISSITRKSNSGPDKQAKETANRLTLKSAAASATAAAKTNGVSPAKTTATTVTKTRKTLTTTTTPSKTKTDNKTEIKAEKIVNETVDIIQSNNINHPLIETKDINLINSITSD